MKELKKFARKTAIISMAVIFTIFFCWLFHLATGIPIRDVILGITLYGVCEAAHNINEMKRL